jgi:hypothetical protein
VENGLQGKGKVTEPLSFNAFVEVLLSQTLQIIDDVRKERRVITPHVLPTPPLGGI